MSLLTSLFPSWELNEASGNAVDSNGSLTATQTNGPGAAAGPGGVGGSRDLEASSLQLFSLADVAGVSMADIDFSMEIWFNAETLPGSGTNMWLAGKWNTAGSDREYALIVSNPSMPECRFLVSSDGATSSNVAVGSGSLSTGTWNQLIGWHDSVNNVIGISLNAGTPATSSYSAGCRDGGSSFMMGARAGPADYFDGLLAKCRVWKRVLTGQERTDLYNGGASLAYSAFGGAAQTAPKIVGKFGGKLKRKVA